MQLHSLLSLLTDPHSISALLERNWIHGLGIAAAIVFLETGIVIFPFLPGDSLLFALGAFIGLAGHPLLPTWSAIAAAAVLGDALNYTIGRTAVGPWILHRRWIRQKHLERTRDYFARYGGSAITVARFVPVVRTIAPFVAGISEMSPRRFLAFNILGGCVWSMLLLGLGTFAGRLPWVQQHFSWVTVMIIAISLVPLAFQWRQARRTRGSPTASSVASQEPRA